MDIPNELIDGIKNDDVFLFVGAGISMNAGLPSWNDLFLPLSKSIGYIWPPTNIATEHLLTTVQYYENKNGRNALIRYLIDNLDTTVKHPSDVHVLISRLPSRLLFTTNYDDLLEKTYREQGKKATVIIDNIEFAFSKEKEIKIIKLCGDIARPDSIVVTKKDFNIFPKSHSGILDKLRAVLETKTVLFLGYSLKDPFINQIWDVINFTFGRFQRLGYCVLFDPDPLEIDDMEKRNLHVINLSGVGRSKSDLLHDWLTDLLQRL